MSKYYAALDWWIDERKDLKEENTRLIKAILGVPEMLVYGNWDYKRCLFCAGKRKMHDPAGCIRKELGEKYEIKRNRLHER